MAPDTNAMNDTNAKVALVGASLAKALRKPNGEAGQIPNQGFSSNEVTAKPYSWLRIFEVFGQFFTGVSTLALSGLALYLTMEFRWDQEQANNSELAEVAWQRCFGLANDAAQYVKTEDDVRRLLDDSSLTTKVTACSKIGFDLQNLLASFARIKESSDQPSAIAVQQPPPSVQKRVPKEASEEVLKALPENNFDFGEVSTQWELIGPQDDPSQLFGIYPDFYALSLLIGADVIKASSFDYERHCTKDELSAAGQMEALSESAKSTWTRLCGASIREILATEPKVERE